VELGEMMHAESPRFRALPYDPAKVAGVALRLIYDPAAQVLVAEPDGQLISMLAGMIVEHCLGPDCYATDYVFYAHPAHRGTSAAPRLYREWLRILQADGRVKEVSLGISTEIHPERSRRFYERLGFRETGAIMVRGLVDDNHV